MKQYFQCEICGFKSEDRQEVLECERFGKDVPLPIGLVFRSKHDGTTYAITSVEMRGHHPYYQCWTPKFRRENVASIIHSFTWGYLTRDEVEPADRQSPSWVALVEALVAENYPVYTLDEQGESQLVHTPEFVPVEKLLNRFLEC